MSVIKASRIHLVLLQFMLVLSIDAWADVKSVQEQRTVTKQPKQFIVKLSDSPLLSQHGTRSTGNKSAKSSSYLQAQKGLWQARQQTLTAAKKANPQIQVLAEFEHIFNGFVVEANTNRKSLLSLPNVMQVYPVYRYRKMLDEVVDIIEAPTAWQFVGGRESAGKGTRIAVIDSGIALNHPMFDDTNIEALPSNELPENNYCLTTDSSFCNNKLISTRFFRPSFVNNSELERLGEFNSPRGLSGHGTHVAGIATGRQVTGLDSTVISGVAPGAYLMVYKALWGQDGEGSDVELLSAVETAVADGADVINNSWGGAAGASPNSSVYREVFQQIEQAGVVLVTAAGNEGEFGISCPGCIESGITVGATTTANAKTSRVIFGSNTLFSAPGDNLTATLDITATAKLAPQSNELGCNSFSADYFSDVIAVIKRGTCDFKDKAINAANAGAEALIVYNNNDSGLISMLMGDATLPSVFISQDDSEILLDYLASESNPTVQVQSNLGADPLNRDQIADFSGTGPNGDVTYIKPDLVAPGDNILSATTTEDTAANGQDYMFNSGTSMATPVVSGAAAIMKQMHPSWDAVTIKHVLMSWSETNLTGVYGIGEATPFQAGAGRLNLAKALLASAVPSRVNLVKTSCVLSCTFDFQVMSLTTSEQSWQAQVEFAEDTIEASLTPSLIQFDANTTEKDVSLSVKYPLSLSEGWYFGRITWTSESGDTMYQTVSFNTQQSDTPLLDINVTDESINRQQIEVNSLNVTGTSNIEYQFEVLGEGQINKDNVTSTGASNVGVTQISEQKVLVSADVQTGSIAISDVPFDIDLSGSNTASLLDCSFSDSCDEVLFEVDLADDDFSFLHFGDAISALKISENGFVSLGTESISDTVELYFNLNFPDSTAPNNLVAPFWADFDLLSPVNDSDTGAGQVYTDIIEQNGERYFVIQWHDIKLYTDANVTAEQVGIADADYLYRFQLIVKENSEQKWFNYISIPDTPFYYSVGIENKLGTIGRSYWFDGSGEAEIVSQSTLLADFSQLQQATFTVTVEDPEVIAFTKNDSVEITEDNSETINVLVNDVLSSANFVAKTTSQTAIAPIFVNRSDIELAASSVAVVVAPQFGGVEVLSNGSIDYTPNSDYHGEDSFQYQVTNQRGESSRSTVSILINNVNDAPIVGEIEGSAEVAAGGEIALSVTATDIDSELSFLWTVPSELTADSVTNQNIALTSQELTQDTSVDISVVVSDGEFQVTRTFSITVLASKNGESDESEENSTSSGFALNIIYLLLLCLAGIRRYVRR